MVAGAAMILGLAVLFGAAPIAAGDSRGGVSGRVTLAGGIPQPARLPVTKHRNVCGDSKPSEDFVVSPSRGLANAVVSIVRGPAVQRVPERPAVLDNRDCVFVPHVQVAVVGQVIEIRSSDRIIHTAHAYDEEKRTLFNVALPVYKRSVRRALTRPGVYRITCDVGHTWMSAYITVADHPYSAVTDRTGGFQISGVLPGSYRLRFWHERLGVREEPMTIRSGAETVVNLAWRWDGSRPSLDTRVRGTP